MMTSLNPNKHTLLYPVSYTHLDVYKRQGYDLPVGLRPVRISSWMGGDRDGNPFVTSKITQQVLYLAPVSYTHLYIA